ncbi:hypothetical protein [Mangrovactinospora gilvigrisea]|nr:hypothetical protein [Mangrovactinospora gilvigrisea]
MTDHPAWTRPPAGTDPERVLLFNNGVWRLRFDGREVLSTLLTAPWENDCRPDAPTAIPVFRIPAARLPTTLPEPARAALEGIEAVVRVPNPSLWDALTAAFIRTNAADEAAARQLYGRWCACFGALPVMDGTTVGCTPPPAVVVHLTARHAEAVGLEQLRPRLRVAAETFLQSAGALARLPGDALVAALVRQTGLPRQAAALAAADFIGDFGLHPINDVLHRAAVRLLVDRSWPEEPRAFARRWRALAATERELSALTLFVLAHATLGSEAAPCAPAPHPP